MDLPETINKEAYLEFIQHRKELKKPVTPIAMKKQIAFLSQFNYETQAAIVDKSIMSGWQGLFPLPAPLVSKEAPWWSSDKSIEEKGKEIGLFAKPGETWQSFRGRINDKLSGQKMH